MHILGIWLPVAAMMLAATLGLPALAEVKNVPYPEVKVTVNEAYKPDAAFEKMRAMFAGAVARKDATALSELVAPTFLWTVNGQPRASWIWGATRFIISRSPSDFARRVRTRTAGSRTGLFGTH